MKTCTKCKVKHSYSYFRKSSLTKDGLDYQCKPCRKLYRATRKDKCNDVTRLWRSKNTTHTKEYNKKYKSDNKEAMYALHNTWILANRDRYLVIKNTSSALRRANKKNAFVGWADKKKIKEFYKEAKRLTLLTGIQHHVDHYYPLVSEYVCGLHCEQNLQILPYYENLSKGNKLPEDIV